MTQAAILVVTGHCKPEDFAPPGSIANLALAVTQHARSRGLVVVSMLSSRVRGSASKHIELRDRAGRLWLLRISDHRSPGDTGYDLPHFDLVSYDGSTGLLQARKFVDQVANREIAWWPPIRLRQRRGAHVRGQKHKPGGCR